MLTHKFKKEIANEYGWDRKTLYNKLRRYGLSISRGLVSPEQQKQIYNRLGYPSGIREADYEDVRDLSDRSIRLVVGQMVTDRHLVKPP